ncbi:hypothetical protein ACUNWD_19755 [Sunxiuqinia sp. A32]|uniref:hypothetical protein n=1 Tax=Sunxiuqinia sp. A32 TaxID=3461496 RepID=UPI00404571F6
MEECRIVIWNASSDEIIRTRMEPFGFDEERHEANKNLFNETTALISANEAEHAEWKTASEAFNGAQDSAREAFSKIRQSLKFWFDASSAEAIALNLYNNKISKYTDFTQAASSFYTSLLTMEEVLDKLVPFGFTPESIEQLLDDISNLDTLRENREKESGDAQYKVKERNSKIDQLHETVAEIIRLARLIFLDDEAQYLEKLGVRVRS